MRPADTTSGRTRSAGPRSGDPEQWEARVDHALRNLGDRGILNRSPLARLAYVERLAAEEYKGHTLPRGLALHDVLVSCIDKICTELGDEPGLSRACAYLRMLVTGLSRKEISKQLGLTREHVSRTYRMRALEIVTEEFLTTVKNGAQDTRKPG